MTELTFTLPVLDTNGNPVVVDDVTLLKQPVGGGAAGTVKTFSAPISIPISVTDAELGAGDWELFLMLRGNGQNSLPSNKVTVSIAAPPGPPTQVTDLAIV